MPSRITKLITCSIFVLLLIASGLTIFAVYTVASTMGIMMHDVLYEIDPSLTGNVLETIAPPYIGTYMESVKPLVVLLGCWIAFALALLYLLNRKINSNTPSDRTR